MFRFLLCSLLLVTLSAQADTSTHKHHDTTGVHGMVLFGDGPLYASHLGLYHHPHDRQIVMPVQFEDPAQARAFSQWREQYHDLITIAPRPFPLAKLDPDSSNLPYTVVADIYAGHFERGGKKQFSSVSLRLGSPLIYRTLLAEGSYQAQARFWLLSGTKSDFAIYQIGPKPDQDWIIETEKFSGCEAQVCEIILSKPAGPELELEKILPIVHGDKVTRLTIKKSLYQEHKDFSF